MPWIPWKQITKECWIQWTFGWDIWVSRFTKFSWLKTTMDMQKLERLSLNPCSENSFTPWWPLVTWQTRMGHGYFLHWPLYVSLLASTHFYDYFYSLTLSYFLKCIHWIFDCFFSIHFMQICAKCELNVSSKEQSDLVTSFLRILMCMLVCAGVLYVCWYMLLSHLDIGVC